MPITIKMPALSPTMEEGTLAKWLVKKGDTVSAGDILAEIETDKATMEFEAVDEGIIADISVDEGTEGVKVGTVIATLAGEGENPDQVEIPAEDSDEPDKKDAESEPAKAAPRADAEPARAEESAAPAPAPAPTPSKDRIIASPLAKRMAKQQGIDLSSITGSGPNGRIVKADIEGAEGQAGSQDKATSPTPTADTAQSGGEGALTNEFGTPYEAQPLNKIRKVIAKRLTQAKQEIPHIYLTVDVRLDALLNLRKQLNEALEPEGIKLSVNDLLIKALAKALAREPQCNVSFAGDELRQFTRVDISVAVAAPSGLITPIIFDAANKSVSQIAREMGDLAGKAREGKLQPAEYQGGTASLSNLGMFGTKQFDAVINPPQAMILAVGAGEQRPHVIDGALGVATMMSATGSFDHRAIDGVDGAKLLAAFKQLVENPLGMIA
jgi:pyruvate dehydrogenase E2 component (dihydrolipoamide acetyltransferase)